jgi:hypothetical protein
MLEFKPSDLDGWNDACFRLPAHNDTVENTSECQNIEAKFLQQNIECNSLDVQGSNNHHEVDTIVAEVEACVPGCSRQGDNK